MLKNLTKKTSVFLLIAMLACNYNNVYSFKLEIFKKKVKKTEVTAPKKEEKPVKGPKAFNQVITKNAKSGKGFISVHKDDNKYYLEIPDSVMGMDLLVVNRIAKSAANSRRDFMGYAGDYIGENVIRFETGKEDKVFLRSVSYTERATDSTGMYRSVLNSNIQPIMAAFEIKAYRKDSVTKKKTTLIEITDFVKSENTVLFFDDRYKKTLGLGGLLADRSYIDTIRAYSRNIEIRTVKTYTQKPSNPNDISSDPYTYELNSSIVLLPKVPMKPRYYDPRVGYFVTGYTDFDKNPQGVERINMITRWRLEPKPEDMEKYKNGELVEPIKPIVYYIDPATPKKWVPYLIQGVNDWQKAFEQAGFKNAIYALEAPNDSTWNLESALTSAIVYKPSDIPNASGPHVHDPRSGEILESHINWYHNVMNLLHHWYFIQQGAVRPEARFMEFDDELMGRLIRFVAAHEVGHTLGLRHNFGSSATVPVEKLRDKKWLSENNHTPSMMDYARFNYVAQPEDSVTDTGMIPDIGIYDKWSIEWGYKYFPQFATAQDEVSFSNQWIMSKLAQDKRFTFGTETDPNDPRNQNEDLGDNAMIAGYYGIKNLQRILPNLIEWTKEPDKDYSNAREMYGELVNQFARYLGHVTKNIGGIYSTPRKVEEKGISMEHVPATIQLDAVRFLEKQLFSTPTWLINRELTERAGVDASLIISNIQRIILGRIINKNTFDKLIQNETLNGAKAFTALQLMTELKTSIFSELASGKNIDVYRRSLQKHYVNALINILDGNSANTIAIMPLAATSSEASSIARYQLTQLKSELNGAMSSSSGLSKAHLLDLIAVINQTLKPD
jgi:hypothetical protein